MHHVESQLILTESALGSQPSLGELLALVDSLSGGTLNPDQAEKVVSLRMGLVHLAQPSMPIPLGDVKVLVGG
jgi:hypothetical protein